MNRSPALLAAPFPSPSPVLVAAFDELRIAAAVPPQSEHELRRLAMLSRPWEPATCPSELRCLIYLWLDDVVGWINEEHTWRVDRMIPICWDQHPHAVHELATVACLRWEASYAVTPAVLEEWHRYTLPMFLERLAQRVGSTGCPPGRHQPHPAASRHAVYLNREERTKRRRRRLCDGEPGSQVSAEPA